LVKVSSAVLSGWEKRWIGPLAGQIAFNIAFSVAGIALNFDRFFFRADAMPSRNLPSSTAL
jgi:hypothetical protein